MYALKIEYRLHTYLHTAWQYTWRLYDAIVLVPLYIWLFPPGWYIKYIEYIPACGGLVLRFSTETLIITWHLSAGLKQYIMSLIRSSPAE